MDISIINFTRSESDESVSKVIRAINRQVREDFEPVWHSSGRLRLEGSDSPAELQRPQEVTGCAVIYLWDSVADESSVLTYHANNNFGRPFGAVFTHLSRSLGEHWSVALSQQALGLLVDAHVNRFAAGPHPTDPARLVFHWLEVCDAVQAETYETDGVTVSNFVYPLYFAIGEQVGARNDFLNRRHGSRTLRAFGVNPGGSIGFVNPNTGRDEVFTLEGDNQAQRRLSLKGQIDPRLRRSNRYAHLQRRARLRTADAWLLG